MNKQNNPKAIAFLSAHGMYSGQINLDSTLNDFFCLLYTSPSPRDS